MPKKLWRKVIFTALDFETIGTKTRNPGVCEIGAVVTDEVFSSLVNPEEEISGSSYWMHGIKSHAVESERIFLQVLPDFKPFLCDKVIVVHDARTEVRALKKVDIALPFILDTCVLARHLRKPLKENALRKLVREYGLRPQETSAPEITLAELLAVCGHESEKRQVR